MSLANQMKLVLYIKTSLKTSIKAMQFKIRLLDIQTLTHVELNKLIKRSTILYEAILLENRIMFKEYAYDFRTRQNSLLVYLVVLGIII